MPNFSVWVPGTLARQQLTAPAATPVFVPQTLKVSLVSRYRYSPLIDQLFARAHSRPPPRFQVQSEPSPLARIKPGPQPPVLQTSVTVVRESTKAAPRRRM